MVFVLNEYNIFEIVNINIVFLIPCSQKSNLNQNKKDMAVDAEFSLNIISDLTYSNIWNSFLEKIRIQISDIAYDTWFSETKLINLNTLIRRGMELNRRSLIKKGEGTSP